MLTLAFFIFFWTVFKQNRFIRLSKGLVRETYSVKEVTFKPSIQYQIFKFTAELHLTRKEVLVILEKLKLIKKLYDNISKTLFCSFPTPKFVKTSQQSFFFFIFLKNSQLKILLDQVWNQISSDLL